MAKKLLKTKGTMKDIARITGLSEMTVSNVLRGKGEHYSQETYDRIMKTAEEVGYRPNLAARHLAKGKTGIIALVLPDILNPYFSELAQLFILEAEKRDYTVILNFTGADRAKEAAIINGAYHLAVDGIILDPLSLDDEDIEHEKVHVPIVLLGERQLTTSFDHVMIDNVSAAKTATQHLIELGRRRIAPIGVTTGSSKGMPFFRMQGYKLAMEEAGLEVPDDLLVPVDLPRFDRGHGARIMEELITRGSIPDGIFCFNDLMAFGAIKVLHSHGYSVPHDIAVIGFDDIIESQFFIPPLSTISQDRTEISRIALDRLIHQINTDNKGSSEIITTSYSLVKRTSTLGK